MLPEPNVQCRGCGDIAWDKQLPPSSLSRMVVGFFTLKRNEVKRYAPGGDKTRNIIDLRCQALGGLIGEYFARELPIFNDLTRPIAHTMFRRSGSEPSRAT